MFINDQQALGSLSRHTNTHFCTSSHTPTQCPLIPPTHSIYAQTHLKHLHTAVNNHRSVGQLKRQRFPVLAKCLSELSRGVEGWAEEPLVDICDSVPRLRRRRDRAYQQQMSQQRVCWKECMSCNQGSEVHGDAEEMLSRSFFQSGGDVVLIKPPAEINFLSVWHRPLGDHVFWIDVMYEHSIIYANELTNQWWAGERWCCTSYVSSLLVSLLEPPPPRS